jgi:hypothetical protein
VLNISSINIRTIVKFLKANGQCDCEICFAFHLTREGDAREIAIIRYAEAAELDIAAIRQLYPRRDVHHFTPENKRIVRSLDKPV